MHNAVQTTICHIVEIWRDVTLVDTHTHGRTECEDRARILETEFAICRSLLKVVHQRGLLLSKLH